MQRTETKSHWINRDVVIKADCEDARLIPGATYRVFGTDYVVNSANRSVLMLRCLPTEEGIVKLGTEEVFVSIRDVEA